MCFKRTRLDGCDCVRTQKEQWGVEGDNTRAACMSKKQKSAMSCTDVIHVKQLWRNCMDIEENT